MNFTSKDFTFSVEGINKKLGLPKTIDIEYDLNYGHVCWGAEVETREWGIKSIYAYVNDYEIEINWSINKSDLTTKDIQKLLQNDLGEFYPADQSEEFITGKIRIDNKKYTVNNNIELAGDLMQINEVIVNFNDYEITIL
jgi:hypothetical protein